MTKRFESKSILITGASSGIGAALSADLARQGARIAMLARREEALDRVRRAIVNEGGDAITFVCDVCDRDAIEKAVASAASAFGGLDVAIANAGYAAKGRFEAMSAEAIRRQFEVNVFGVTNTIQAVLPHLKRSRGQLAIVSSFLGRLGAPGSSIYCASKFALCGLAESLSYELAQYGVGVTCVNPGVVDSEIRRVNEAGIFDPSEVDPAPAWLRMPADRAARIISRAIARRQFEVVVTRHAQIAVTMARHFPRTWRFLIGQLVKRGKTSADRE